MPGDKDYDNRRNRFALGGIKQESYYLSKNTPEYLYPSTEFMAWSATFTFITLNEPSGSDKL
jgi:hypothetical protein